MNSSVPPHPLRRCILDPDEMTCGSSQSIYVGSVCEPMHQVNQGCYVSPTSCLRALLALPASNHVEVEHTAGYDYLTIYAHDRSVNALRAITYEPSLPSDETLLWSAPPQFESDAQHTYSQLSQVEQTNPADRFTLYNFMHGLGARPTQSLWCTQHVYPMESVQPRDTKCKNGRR